VYKSLIFTLNDRQFEHSGELPAVTSSPDGFIATFANKPVEIFAYKDGRLSDGSALDGIEVRIESQRDRLIKERFAETAKGTGSLAGKQHAIKAPMPGLVKKILLAIGEPVSKLTPLFILEAMKMENVLTAGKQGVLSELRVEEGKNVEKNTILCLITED
jgi:biotin carboxyl carrier protein